MNRVIVSVDLDRSVEGQTKFYISCEDYRSHRERQKELIKEKGKQASVYWLSLEQNHACLNRSN